MLAVWKSEERSSCFTRKLSGFGVPDGIPCERPEGVSSCCSGEEAWDGDGQAGRRRYCGSRRQGSDRPASPALGWLSCRRRLVAPDGRRHLAPDGPSWPESGPATVCSVRRLGVAAGPGLSLHSPVGEAVRARPATCTPPTAPVRSWGTATDMSGAATLRDQAVKRLTLEGPALPPVGGPVNPGPSPHPRRTGPRPGPSPAVGPGRHRRKSAAVFPRPGVTRVTPRRRWPA